jgi:ABC-type Zn uptake system ZnuABC Zn-binding protein ZnuA
VDEAIAEKRFPRKYGSARYCECPLIDNDSQLVYHCLAIENPSHLLKRERIIPMNHIPNQPWRWLTLFALLLMLVSGCAAPAPSPTLASAPTAAAEEDAAHGDEEDADEDHDDEHEGEGHDEEAHAGETLPTLSALALDGRKLRAVATTNLVGDAVARIGGDNIELTVLLTPGTDPHAYQLTPGDRQLLEEADVIFANGLGLEEGMLPVIEELESRVAVVSVNAGVTTLEFGGHADEHGDDEHGDEEHGDEEHGDEEHGDEEHGDEEHGDEEHGDEEHGDDEHGDEEHGDEEHGDEEHGDEEHAEEAGHIHEGGDPHTWQSVPNVMVWAQNIAAVLSQLDPAQAESYAAAAAEYEAELEVLEAELQALVAELPAEARKLVTDHSSLGYLADGYGFTIVGAVIPALSTVAAASAQELAALQDQINAEGVKAIFVGTTVNAQLVEQLAADLGIAVVPIYTDSLSEPDGPAASYPDFMRYNMQTIVDALAE